MFVNGITEQPKVAEMSHYFDGFASVKIEKVTHLPDEYDDEQLVTLENGVVFIAKGYDGLFLEGQIVRARFIDAQEQQIVLVTMLPDGTGALHQFQRLR